MSKKGILVLVFVLDFTFFLSAFECRSVSRCCCEIWLPFLLSFLICVVGIYSCFWLSSFNSFRVGHPFVISLFTLCVHITVVALSVVAKGKIFFLFQMLLYLFLLFFCSCFSPYFLSPLFCSTILDSPFCFTKPNCSFGITNLSYTQ